MTRSSGLNALTEVSRYTVISQNPHNQLRTLSVTTHVSVKDPEDGGRFSCAVVSIYKSTRYHNAANRIRNIFLKKSLTKPIIKLPTICVYCIRILFAVGLNVYAVTAKVRLTCYDGTWGSRCIALLRPNLDAKWGGWSTSCPGRFTTAKRAGIHWKRLGGIQCRYGRVLARRKSLSLTGNRAPDRPASAERL
jgi:hypothetical protein